MIQQRNSNIEILRFVLMAFIFLWHIILHGYDFMGTCSSDSNLTILSFCCALFSPAVYCFMLISGWYGIKFSLKKYAHLAFMAIVCFCLSIIIRHFWGGIRPAIIIEFIFPISCSFWWFLTCYVMVFLIAPFINLGFEQLESKMIKQIIGIMTIIEVACLFNLIPNMGSTFYGLLYIYFLGRYLKRFNVSFSTVKLGLIYILSLIVLWNMVYWGYDIAINGSKLSFILLSYNNPCIIMMAICIFFLFQKIRPTYNSKTNAFLSDVLAIYLVTEGIGQPLYQYLANAMSQNVIFGILIVFIIMIVTILLGKLTTKSFLWLWSKYIYTKKLAICE